MPSSIRLIAIDIDGTLLDSNWQLPTANVEALVAASERGIEIVPATGRRFPFAREICAQLPVPWTLIASNGAVIKTDTGHTLAHQNLPTDTALEILAAAGNARDTALLLFDAEGPGEIITENASTSHAPLAKYFERNSHLLLEVARLEDALHTNPLQVMFAGPVEPMRALWSTLEAAECRPRVNIARTEYIDRDLTMVDVLAAGCHKGAALEQLCEIRGFEPSQVMAIGDNFNDLEMLEFAGTPVLMGNSDPKIRRDGWHITGTNDEAGVAQAIDKFVLSEQAGSPKG